MRDGVPSYLGDGEIPPEAVAELFSVAELLFRAAPWRHLLDQQIVQVDIPAYDIDDACLSIIGAAGETFGLLLFRSIEDFQRFALTMRHPADGKAALRSVSFDRKKDLPPKMLREIERHRWPVAGPKAYPVLISLDSELQPLTTTERDVRIMTACTRAFLAFFARFGNDFTDENGEAVSASFTGDDDITVTVTASYEDVSDDDFDDDFFEPPPTPPPAPRVGRNDPCPCGSGKKYKKCHLDAGPVPQRAPSHIEIVREMDVRVVTAMAHYASKRFGPGWLAADLARDPDALNMLLPWSTWTAVVGPTSVAAAFLEANGRRLSPEERDWCAAQQVAWPSIWEVTQVQPELLVVRDLLTGETRSISDDQASAAVARDTLLARVIDYRGHSYFGGVHRCLLPVSEAAAVIEDVRAKLNWSGGAVPIARLQNRDVGLLLIDGWTDALEKG